MAKNKTRSKQRLYKMKGCFKGSRKKNYLGGTYLAYTGEKTAPVNNPFLAYTSGGGAPDLTRASMSPGPNPSGFNFPNPQQPLNGGGYGRMMSGGDCGCGASPLMGGGYSRLMAGGDCGCGNPLMGGGQRGHGKNCMCGTCKRKRNRKSRKMKGGTMSYPNGLIGKPWGGAIQKWPGVDGVDGGRNHLGYNTYSPVDISRQMKFVSASGGGRKMKTRKQKGGFIANDLLNLSKFGAGSFYNAIKGYPQPVSPLPWKDQLAAY